MSPPFTALFEEATYNVGAWNDAFLPDEQHERLYHEIMVRIPGLDQDEIHRR